MNLKVRESNRWCAVAYDERPTAAKLRREILREEGVESGFSILTAPAPAHDDTVFKVVGNEKDILVGVALYDTVRFLSTRGGEGMPDDAEMFFDPLNDRIGWFQFLFALGKRAAGGGVIDPHRDPAPTDALQVNSHLPYPEAHSSACFGLRLKRHQFREEVFSVCPITRPVCGWLFAWFPTAEVFRRGGVCGFNVCRHRPYLAEFSSWNYCGGNGSQDATDFGRLYRFEGPASVADVRAQLEGKMLHIEGSVSGASDGWAFELAGPRDQRFLFPTTVTDGRWKGVVEIDPCVGGRYRLYARCGGRPVEPRYHSIDVPTAAGARRFCIAVTYDSPMSIISNYYTPERLDRDMAIWSDLGVRRIHWIEYGNWPSFWSWPGYDWGPNYRKTTEHCGDYLTAGVRAAHKHEMELIADLKTFDLGMNCFFPRPDGKSTILELENRHVSAIPEIAAHPEWTMQSNPAWRREASLPVERLRVYSERPLPTLRRADVRLLMSKDNRRYHAYRKPFKFEQGVMHRAHQRWTPAGNVKEEGGRRNWFVEFSGLNLAEPYVAVQLGERPVWFHHRGHMLVEACDASGNAVPLTVATNGDAKGGFFFWRGWQGWSNQTDAILQERKWNGNDLGLVFREKPDMPTMLEPGYEGARRIWLARMQQIIDSGADGVDIRTYCHHNGPMSYLKYAFAPAVCERFRELHGREPRPVAEDYERIRCIRGAFYTEFMREARALTAAHRRKLMVELESGIEVPPEYDCRMQLPMEWRTWIEERLIDEIRLKWWTAESTFVHEQVLPLARTHDIPVSVISRCLHTGFDIRASEMAALVVGGACAAGFSGYSYYEQQNLMDLNPEGRSTLKGPVRQYFASVRETLREAGAHPQGQ